MRSDITRHTMVQRQRGPARYRTDGDGRAEVQAGIHLLTASS